MSSALGQQPELAVGSVLCRERGHLLKWFQFGQTFTTRTEQVIGEVFIHKIITDLKQVAFETGVQ